MDNKEYAEILEEIATLQRVVGDNFFKVRAFSRAARLIENFAEPIDDLVDQRRLHEIDGIGESIEEELQALRITGASPRHEELLDRIGRDVMDLWHIPGLGIKRIQTLYQELGIASIPSLKQAALDGRLATLSGFGGGVQDKLLLEIEGWERGRGRRFPLPEAKGLAESIRFELLNLPEVARCEVGGSIRRGKETIGDIDLLVTTDAARTVSDYFKSLPDVTEIIFDGDTRASVRVTNEIQCDLRVIDTHLFGAGLHYFTGNKDHHIQMRIRSKKMGLKISEKGVMHYDDPTETIVGPMDTEEQVFNAVGLPYIAPEIRMGKDEIKAGEDGTLPDLVYPHHVQGDVHLSSTISGGRDALPDLIQALQKRGYKWCVVTEKTKTLHAKGIDDRGLKEHIERVKKLNAMIDGFTVLSGVECEITFDGMLDIDLRLAAECDWVLAGVTTDTDVDADTMTQRLMWGMETGVVSCLAHPTGRHLGVHDGYKMYFEEVVQCANDFGVALEISGDPQRLDLNAQMAGRAKHLGAMLVCGSAATSVESLDHIEYALQQARRAWMEPKDLLNCVSAEELISRTRTLIR